MATSFWLYKGRHGEQMLFPGTREGFDRARAEQDADNRATLDEIRRDMGEDALYGSPYGETDSFSIDDGGQITRIELSE